MNHRMRTLIWTAVVWWGLTAPIGTAEPATAAAEWAGDPVAVANGGKRDCRRKGINLWGRVQVVESFEDLRVQVVTSFEDLRVKVVTRFPDSCGKWQFVDSFPDFKIRYVDAFPDLKIRFVESFPGQD